MGHAQYLLWAKHILAEIRDCCTSAVQTKHNNNTREQGSRLLECRCRVVGRLVRTTRRATRALAILGWLLSCLSPPKLRWTRLAPSHHHDPPVLGPRTNMPPHKKYDWSDKRDLCYQLYVEEERTLPELKEYFSQALGVAADSIPSYVLPLSSTVLRTPLSHVKTRFQYPLLVFTNAAQNPDLQSPVQGMGLSQALGKVNPRSRGEICRTHQAALGAELSQWRDRIDHAQ